MSGAIRSSMGPALKRVKTLVEGAEPILKMNNISDRNLKALRLGINSRIP